MLLFSILLETYVNKSCISLQIYHTTKLKDPTLIFPSDFPTCEVHIVSMFVLLKTVTKLQYGVV